MITARDELGAHLSIAGGLHRALERGRDLGCGAVQIFLKNHRQWAAKPLAPDDVRAFRAARRTAGVRHLFAHASYLINLAAPAPAAWAQAVAAFADELERAERLGLSFVVIHPGSPLEDDRAAGLARVTAALDEVARRTAGYRVKVALENTAGAGHTLGRSFEELRLLLERAQHPERLGICIDTCHLFAAGYDIRSAAGYARTMAQLESTVGAPRVLAFHLNDALAPLGSGLDRHQHIGRGLLGRRPFRLLLGDPRFRRIPKVLETPKEPDPIADRANLRLLRALRASATSSRPPADRARAPGTSSNAARAACTRSVRSSRGGR